MQRTVTKNRINGAAAGVQGRNRFAGLALVFLSFVVQVLGDYYYYYY